VLLDSRRTQRRIAQPAAPILATLNNDVQLRGRVHIGLDQLWQAAETMLGRQLDPLDPQLLDHLECPL